MWETCLKHSTEIIALVLGSGILGYLWSKWFGSSSKNDGMKAEYENQIHSLSTKLRNYDAELKNAHSLQSSWAAEKTGLLANIDELTDKANAVKNSFTGFVSPEEYHALQARFNQDIKSAGEKVNSLANEKLLLQKSLADLESSSKMAYAALENKVNELQDQVQIAFNEKKNLEVKFESDLQAKSNEIIKLQSQLDGAFSKYGDTSKEIETYKTSIENLKQALEGAENQIAQRDKEYLSKISHTQSDLESANKALAETVAKLNQSDEANQAGMAKLNEITSRVHQLENELAQARAEASSFKSKTADLDKLTSTLSDADRKAKEWEARWKEMSTEADQYKVAHANTVNERDTLKQKINQLESEIIGAKNQVEQIKKEHQAEAEHHVSEFQAKLINAEHDLQTWQNKSHELEAEIENLKAHIEEANLNLIESKKQYDAQQITTEGLTHRVLELENLVDSRVNELTAIHSELAEANTKVIALNASGNNVAIQLTEAENRYKELTVEADQYKVSLSNTAKERDALRQRVNQLESEIIGAKNEVELIQKASQEEVDLKITEFQSKLDEAARELQAWQDKSQQLEAELENYKAYIEETNLKQIETKKQYDAQQSITEGLSHRVLELENRVETRETELKAIYDQLAEANNKINSFQASENNASIQLAEAENRYQEITTRFNIVQTHLADLQKSTNVSAQQLHDFETRNKELNDRLNTIQLQLNEAHEANDTGNRHLQGVEAKNKELTEQVIKLQNQLEDHKASENSAKQIQETTDAKFKELSTKFNTVQLQLADALRVKSHLEESINKKSDDLNKKYLAESTAWQKRISDLENDHANKVSIYQSRISQLESTPPKIVEKIVEKEVEVPKIIEKIVEKIVEVPKIVEKIVTVEKIVNLPAVIPANKTILPIPATVAKPPAKISTKLVSDKKMTTPKTGVKVKTVTTPAAREVDWKTVSATFGKKIKANDHILIEGIGPKINTLLKKSKITTWTQLANTSVKDIQAILDKGGNKFSFANPSSWPRQASLAEQGKWDELKKYQDELNIGRKVKSKSKPSSGPIISGIKTVAKKGLKAKTITKKTTVKKVNKPVIKKTTPKPLDLGKGASILGMKFKENDLKIVEGIGPKIEKLLKKAGLNTWKKLAGAETKTIQSILDKAGSNYSLADPKTWAKQSNLAATGDWEKLKKIQESLISRKKTK